MIAAKLTWNATQATAEIQARGWQGIARAVVYLHTQLLHALNVSNPRPYTTPSRPGEAPRKRTGWLQRNVLYELDKDAMTGRVGVTKNAQYGLYLELGTKRMAARPWLWATVERCWRQLQALAMGG